MALRGNEAKEEIDRRYGGVDRLLARLQTSATEGITANVEDIARRKQMFGSNTVPPKKLKSFLQLLFERLLDMIIMILVVAALNSLGLFFYKPTETEQPSCGPAVCGRHDEGECGAGWINGIATLLSVVHLVLVVAVINRLKGKLPPSLIEEDQTFSVHRAGQVLDVTQSEIVVGDILLLKPRDIIPADGILIQGNDLKIDERY